MPQRVAGETIEPLVSEPMAKPTKPAATVAAGPADEPSDPLLIGNHGCAKTHLANSIAEALGKRFLVYDASKTMFEDVLGYPNVPLAV